MSRMWMHLHRRGSLHPKSGTALEYVHPFPMLVVSLCILKRLYAAERGSARAEAQWQAEQQLLCHPHAMFSISCMTSRLCYAQA